MLPGHLYIPLWKTNINPDENFLIGFLQFDEQTNWWQPCGWDEEFEDPQVAATEFYTWWSLLPKADQTNFGKDVPPKNQNRMSMN